MSLKFVEHVPEAMQGIADDERKGQAHARKTNCGKRQDHSRLHTPRRRRSEVGRERQVEPGDHDEKHREEDCGNRRQAAQQGVAVISGPTL